jgi:DNA-binding response OmpR family regulator
MDQRMPSNHSLQSETQATATPEDTEGPHILVIEDEASIQRLVRLYLERAGYRVVTSHNGQTGLDLHEHLHPDLVVLDLMLPVMDGWEVCRRIRKRSRTPILMLTARNEESSLVEGLDLGADDYMTKPFSPRELVSRVRAILRRATPPGWEAAAPERLVFSDLVIMPAARRVEVDGQSLELTAKEFDLLLTFARRPDYVFSREELLSRVWGYNYLGDSRTVDVHVGTLRKKMERDPAHPRFIVTVWRAGYRFDAQADTLDDTHGPGNVHRAGEHL